LAQVIVVVVTDSVSVATYCDEQQTPEVACDVLAVETSVTLGEAMNVTCFSCTNASHIRNLYLALTNQNVFKGSSIKDICSKGGGLAQM